LPRRKFPKPADSSSKSIFFKLLKFHLETQKYWMLAVDATLKTKALESVQGARAKGVRRKLNTKIPSKKKLGIVAVEQQIQKVGMHRTAAQTNEPQICHHTQSSLDRFVQWGPHPASIMGSLRSNERLQQD
jgi:hypothetical protein